jgi:hypothetical protein
VKTARLAAALALLTSCSGRAPGPPPPALDAAAESYVRLVLALGERDTDSLDSYHGPPAWQEEARARHATLADIQTAAASLAESLKSVTGEDPRRTFLIRQLRAVVARIDILRGARPRFAEEARALFGLEPPEVDSTADAASIRAAIDRLLPGNGELSRRYAAFDRAFLIPPDRTPSVLSRALEGCRTVTRAHLNLPSTERVDVEYVHDLPWSAFTRYQRAYTSRLQVNAAMPLTVDRALDLACHEGYPGHHTISALIDAAFGSRRVELLVQPLFSPQSLLHEAASSLAGSLAFPDAARLAFERDELFPLAGLDPAGADRHVQVGRLVDQLHAVQAGIARRYLDGELDFPRAATAFERDALMPSADATLKFLNRYRTYAATYTIGRDAVSRDLDAGARRHGGDNGRWLAYAELVTNPTQMAPSEAAARR